MIQRIRTLGKPFRLQKSLKNCHQSIKFSVQNSLKLTYGHFFKYVSGGKVPGTQKQRGGRGRNIVGGKGRITEGG
jgi:hypothetical protein